MKYLFSIFTLLQCVMVSNAQGCYKETRKHAVEVFSQSNFKYAKQVFNAAKFCPDLPAKNDLKYWIGRCDKALNPKAQQSELNFAQKLALYEPDGDWSEGLLPVTKKSDWKKYEFNTADNDNPYSSLPKVGFIDEKGNLVIPCQYLQSGLFGPETMVNVFSEGLAPVAKYFDNDGYQALGYINKKGQTVIPFKYAYGTIFGNGRAAVVEDEEDYWAEKPSWTILNESGVKITDEQYYRVGTFSEGLCAVKNEPEGRWGYIDITGKQIIPFKYSATNGFKDGRAVVFMEHEHGKYESALIDHTGQIVSDFRFRPESLDLETLFNYAIDSDASKEYEKAFEALNAYENRCRNKGIWFANGNTSSNEGIVATMLGYYYYTGLGGASKNYTRAIDYWSLAKSYKGGLYWLGVAYYSGNGVIQDFEKARNYLIEVIEKEKNSKSTYYTSQAAYFVGIIYYYGYSMSKPDFNLAKLYFTMAYENGNELAKDMIELCSQK